MAQKHMQPWAAMALMATSVSVTKRQKQAFTKHLPEEALPRSVSANNTQREII